jgi:hypothetical protein
VAPGSAVLGGTGTATLDSRSGWLFRVLTKEKNMHGPEHDDDKTVEERAEGNEVIDLRDGAGWEESARDVDES